MEMHLERGVTLIYTWFIHQVHKSSAQRFEVSNNGIALITNWYVSFCGLFRGEFESAKLLEIRSRHAWSCDCQVMISQSVRRSCSRCIAKPELRADFRLIQAISLACIVITADQNGSFVGLPQLWFSDGTALVTIALIVWRARSINSFKCFECLFKIASKLVFNSADIVWLSRDLCGNAYICVETCKRLVALGSVGESTASSHLIAGLRSWTLRAWAGDSSWCWNGQRGSISGDWGWTCCSRALQKSFEITSTL